MVAAKSCGEGSMEFVCNGQSLVGKMKKFRRQTMVMVMDGTTGTNATEVYI